MLCLFSQVHLSSCIVDTNAWAVSAQVDGRASVSYTNAANRLQYFIGEQTYTIRPCDTELYVLGYLPQLSRIFAADKDMNLYSFSLSLAVVEYQTAILQGNFALAESLLPQVPHGQRGKVAKFLETQDMPDLALQLSLIHI